MPHLQEEISAKSAAAAAVKHAFVRYPHTPHLAWLGDNPPRDDKVLSSSEAQALLAGEVVVEEKVDGANLGFSLDSVGQLQAQNRGQCLAYPASGQFARLPQWLAMHGESLKSVIDPQWIVFGEWCAARHSLAYDRLPDWWLAFDVYDRKSGRFLPTSGRNDLAKRSGLSVTAELFRGHATLASLTRLVSEASSRYRNGALEGIVVRADRLLAPPARAKLVRADFTQAISSHWRQRPIEWNRLACDAAILPR